MSRKEGDNQNIIYPHSKFHLMCGGEKVELGASVGAMDSVEAIHRFSADDIRKYLNDNDLAAALLLAATRTERIFFEKLRHRLGVSPSIGERLFGRMSLGGYYEWCKQLNLLLEKDLTPLSDLNKKRRRLTHEDGYSRNLRSDEEEMKEVKGILKHVMDFVEEAEIRVHGEG